MNPISKLFLPNDVKSKPIKFAQVKDTEQSLLTQGGGFDTVSFSGNQTKTEKFEDVLAELRANIPDRTSTIEEKELAIEYIDRMLACDDIPQDVKTFWSYNKTIIQAEIQSIKNQNFTNNEKFDDIINELNEFVENYQKSEPKEFLSQQDRSNYWRTYNNTCISYYERALNASDISDETREYCLRMINLHKRDNNNLQTDMNNYNKENHVKTESFQNVFNEFTRNVPDRTTTIAEKELAISYINRMLSCDDIPDDLKLYWSNKKDIIEMEIQNIENQNKIGKGETIADVAKEWRAFCDKYFNEFDPKLSIQDQKENRLTYYRTYLSFCERFLACKDITDEQRSEYLRMMSNANRDIANWQKM